MSKISRWPWARNLHPSMVSTEHVEYMYFVQNPCVDASHKKCRYNSRCVYQITKDIVLEEPQPVTAAVLPSGLRNLGATCYVNTQLQVWYHLAEFRDLVFSLPDLTDQQRPPSTLSQPFPVTRERSYSSLAYAGSLVSADFDSGAENGGDPTVHENSPDDAISTSILNASTSQTSITLDLERSPLKRNLTAVSGIMAPACSATILKNTLSADSCVIDLESPPSKSARLEAACSRVSERGDEDCLEPGEPRNESDHEPKCLTDDTLTPATERLSRVDRSSSGEFDSSRDSSNGVCRMDTGTGDSCADTSSHIHSRSSYAATDGSSALFASPTGTGPSGSATNTSSATSTLQDPMVELQRIFTALYLRLTAVVDPTAFVDSLLLDHTEQQDAPEFGKLFLPKLEETCEVFGQRPPLASLFAGRYQQATVCAECGFTSVQREVPWNDLEVPLMGSSLHLIGPGGDGTGCLDTMFTAEKLVKENRYFCPLCDQLRNATRQTSLTVVPRVLTLQLLRFQFDKKKLARKKLTRPLSFPLKLSLAPYMSPELQDTGEVEYELYAILMHVGRAAQHGHYTAVLRQQVEPRDWFVFSDRDVEAFSEESTLHDIKVLEPGELWKSGNAYTLLYLRRDTISDSRAPPTTVLSRVNEELQAELLQEQSRVARRGEEREFRRRLLDALATPCLDINSCYWVKSEWLRNVLHSSSISPHDNSNLLCSHGKLDPNQIERVKLVSREVVEVVAAAGPLLPYITTTCIACVRAIVFKEYYTRIVSVDWKRISTSRSLGGDFLIAATDLRDFRKTAQRVVADAAQLADIVDGDYARAFALVADPFHTALRCSHGGIATTGLTRVNEDVLDFIGFYFPSLEQVSADASPCSECLEEDSVAKEALRVIRTLRLAASEELLLGQSYRLLAADFLDSWEEYLRCSPRGEAVSPLLALCQHSKLPFSLDSTSMLLLSEDNFAVLASILPSALELREAEWTSHGWSLPVEVCSSCSAEHESRVMAEKLAFEHGFVYVKTVSDLSDMPSPSQLSDEYLPRSRRTRGRGVKVSCSSDDTVSNIALHVYSERGITPADQKLYFGGERLCLELSLAQLGISSGAELYLLQLPGEEDNQNGFDVDGTARECGFKNSVLGGNACVTSD